MRLLVLVACALLVSLVARAACAEGDDPPREALERAAESDDKNAAAEALFQLGQLDEKELLFARALERYQASVARSPSSRYAGRAMSRADQLKAHAEGGFAPLAALERVRRDPALSSDSSAVDALLRDAATFPPGLVRVEARMLCAEAYAGRLHRTADAIATWRAIVADSAADPLTARQAARQIVETEAQAGELDAARTDARALRSKLDPAFVTHVERLVRRRALHVGAIGSLAAMAALVAIALARAARRRALPSVADGVRRALPVLVLFAAYIAIAGGVLASKYEAGNSKPFLALAIALLPVVVAARAWGAAGSPSGAARAGRAAVAAVCAIATAFLVLERIDAAYLDGFGL